MAVNPWALEPLSLHGWRIECDNACGLVVTIEGVNAATAREMFGCFFEAVSEPPHVSTLCHSCAARLGKSNRSEGAPPATVAGGNVSRARRVR